MIPPVKLAVPPIKSLPDTVPPTAIREKHGLRRRPVEVVIEISREIPTSARLTLRESCTHGERDILTVFHGDSSVGFLSHQRQCKKKEQSDTASNGNHTGVSRTRSSEPIGMPLFPRRNPLAPECWLRVCVFIMTSFWSWVEAVMNTYRCGAPAALRCFSGGQRAS